MRCVEDGAPTQEHGVELGLADFGLGSASRFGQSCPVPGAMSSTHHPWTPTCARRTSPGFAATGGTLCKVRLILR